MSSRSAACWTGSRRPAAPKSISASRPSAQQHHVARVRVGVEHAVLEHLLEERAQQRVGELRRGRRCACRPSRPRARSRRRATPSRARATCSGPRTRRARRCASRSEGMVAAIARALRASMRKSSSSRKRELNSCDEIHHVVVGTPRRARLDHPAELLEHRQVDARPTRRCPGRCTFTTTGEPSGSAARYTWPIEAAASGCQSKFANTLVAAGRRAPPRAARRRRRGRAGARGPGAATSSVAASGEMRSVRVERSARASRTSRRTPRARAGGAAPAGGAGRPRTLVLAARGRATVRGRCAPRCA